MVDAEGNTRRERVLQVFGFMGLNRVEVPEAQAGDIVAFTGIPAPRISETLCDPEHVEALPSLTVDEPTISMMFETNSSPFAGQDGKFLTSRQVRERLYRETLHNVALRVEDSEDTEKFRVSGRGELHLSVLLETMRREGYEIAVSRPQVIYHEVRRRAARALREPDGGRGRPSPGRHHGSPRVRAAAALQDMRPDGQRSRAPGLHHPGPRPHRFPDRLPHPDLGRGPHCTTCSTTTPRPRPWA